VLLGVVPVILLVMLLGSAGAHGAPSGRPAMDPGAAETAPTYAIEGVVVDQYSGTPLANVTVHALDVAQIAHQAITDDRGRFVLTVPSGFLYLTVDPPSGYDGVQTHLTVRGAPLTGIVLALAPSGELGRVAGAGDAAVLPAFAAAVAASAVAGIAVGWRRRREAGLAPALLSRFAGFVLRRILLIPLQLLAVLIILYIFGSYFPELALAQQTGCLSTAGGPCAPCDPSAFGCQISVFWSGLGDFLRSILLGNWGLASIGAFRLPAVDFLQWWLPNSVQLAVVALLVSVVIGYPLGIAAGWRTDGFLDRGIRGVSVALLLLPTFLVVLFILLAVYDPWRAAFAGETPYGLFPSDLWYEQNGGAPVWIDRFNHSSPTGFSILDGALHGDWPFVVQVGSRLLLQAFAIALIYVAIFLRYARHAIAEFSHTEWVRAGRSRGIPEATLEWHHTARRALPIYLLVFGMTLPAYIGTQAVVEVLFGDSQGLGTILFAEMTQIGSTGFGFIHQGRAVFGNLYQVAVLFLVLMILAGNLCADILARYLDPTLADEVPR
jgi:peptide/nickel transport system permease protein